MPQIEATFVVEPYDITITTDSSNIQVQPTAIDLNIFTAGFSPPAGNNGELQYNNAGTLAGVPVALYSNGNVNFSAVSNVKIPGGANTYFLQTDGTGNLTWAPGTVTANTGNGIASGANTQIQMTDGTGNFVGAPGFTFDYVANSLTVPGDGLFSGNVTANYFFGNGAFLTGIDPSEISNGSSNVKVYSSGNVAVTIAGVSNIAVVDSFGVTVVGNINSDNADLGNLATANFFSGNANLLSNIPGANVIGTVANATHASTANTVTTNAQPNITSVGTLSSLNITGNLSSGNANLGNVATANYFVGNIANGNISNITFANIDNANINNLQVNSGNITLGSNAGNVNQGTYGIAIGYEAGMNNQSDYSLAIGWGAGREDQIGERAIAIGHEAGQNLQSQDTIAIGTSAGYLGQRSNAIALGWYAGFNDQGNNSIAIGALSGYGLGGQLPLSSQHDNTIILNATNANLQSDGANRFFVKPVRQANTSNILFYNDTTGEITQSDAIQSLKENVVSNSTGSTGTVNFDLLDSAILFKTANATTNFTINLRGNSITTLDSIMSANQSLTCSFINTNGSAAYIANVIQIDGVNVTPLYPSIVGGTQNGKDLYTFNIIKTAANTYTVLGSVTGYS